MVVREQSRDKPAMTARSKATGYLPDVDLLLAAMPIACALFDADGANLSVANTLFVEAFGQPPTLSALAEQFHSLNLNATIEAMQTEEVFHAPTRRWYEITCAPMRRGSFHGILISATDISQRQQALSAHKSQHEKLLFTSRSMSVGEMATTLAHELNQPLAAIINYLGVGLHLLERDGLDNGRLGEALQHARDQAVHASQVITRLREFVRAREPRREAQVPAELVATVLRLLALEADKQRVCISVEIPAELPRVHADRVMIEQVLLNLTKNGIEAMREREPELRQLQVRALRNLDDQIEFRVADNGCGLSPTESERLFTPFFTTKADGMGIGLAICRSIIEYHQGRLYVEPNPGGGSVFVFTLPPADLEELS